MNKLFYPRLAANNLNKNTKTYIPYLLTCIGTIIMFYNMCFLAFAREIGKIGDSRSLRYILILGAVVIGIFSVIFLFYTNSFLIKRRKKEFGLFNILGMEKKHVARVMFFETLLTAVVSLAAGILGGILLSKLIILLLFKIISFEVSFGFEVPVSAVLYTLALFGGIFVMNLAYNIFQVRLSKPIELLKGGNVGEKEPKTKWLLASLGAILLGGGYYIALSTDSPLAALNIFFVAVILVIAGTYCLFTAGSIAILKILRSNKRYYYKLKHFTSVSGLLYRMKQNAAGLANICILSTAVIVMLSTTISMYIGMEDVLRTRYPRNIIVSALNASKEQAERLDAVIKQQADVAQVALKDVIRYRSMSFMLLQDGTRFTPALPASLSSSHFAMAVFVPLEDYNRMENKSISLSEGEVLLYTLRGNIAGDTVSFGGLKLSIRDRLASLSTEGKTPASLSNSYYVIVDSTDTIKKIYASLNGKKADMKELSYYYGFDVSGDREVQIKLVKDLQKAVKAAGVNGFAEGAENSRKSFFTLYGGLFFLGLFLGLLFIMATVLIIYYKQIAEGYDDRDRFEIMQKVGMSHTEVRKTIHSQVLTVFFLPLVTAVIHLAVGFKVITKLLAVLNLTNIPLFAACTAVTILVFAGFYSLIYAFTARTYYRIVS